MRVQEATFAISQELASMEQRVLAYKSTVFELENKISLIIKENERISVAYDQKLKEIDVLNYRSQNLERVRAAELEQIREELEKRGNETFVLHFPGIFLIKFEKEARVSDLRLQFENEKRLIVADFKELQQKAIDYENKISYFTIEIERLTGIISEKTADFEEIRGKYQELSSQFAKLKETRLINFNEVRSSAENTRLETEIKYLQGKVREYEALNAQLQREVQDFNGFSAKRAQEIADLRQKITVLRENPENLRNSYEEFLRVQKDYQELSYNKRVEIENLQAKLQEMRAAVEGKSLESKELARLLSQEREERRKLQEKIEKLQGNRAVSLHYSSSSKETDGFRFENEELY